MLPILNTTRRTLACFYFCLTALLPLLSEARPIPKSVIIINSLTAPGCSRINYESHPTYESVQGLKIGQLVLDHPEWALEDKQRCINRPAIAFLPEGRNNTFLAIEEEIAFQKVGLKVYHQVTSGGKTWLSIKTRDSDKYMWIIKDDLEMDLLSYQDELAQGLGIFSETCDNMYCTPVPRQIQTTFAKAGLDSIDCPNSAYDILRVEVHSATGRKVYAVQLKDELVAKYGMVLPLTAQVPVTDYRNNWTGIYSPGECDN